MALQVWLPLNGNLNNQGLTNYTIINNEATVDNNGKIGKCYSFNGTSKYLRINEKVITTSQYSIAFWMYMTDVSGNRCIFSTRNVNSGAVNIYALPVGIRFDTSTTANWQTSFKPSANTWYHITLVQDATTKYLYVNGVLNTSIAGTTDLTQVSSVCTIGCEHINGSSIGTYYIGKLNDFRIYDHALSPKEIEILSRGLVCHYPLCNNGNGQANLLKNSNFTEGSSGSQGYNFSATWAKQTDCMKITSTSAAAGLYTANYDSVTTGDMATFSAYVKADTSMTIYIGVDGSGIGNCESFTVGTSWQRISISKAKTTDNANLRVYGNGTFYVRHMKYELGSTVTPWCPNSADSIYSSMGYSDTTEYDVSGYGNNGTRTGTITYTSESPRYSVCSYIPKAGYIQHPNALGADNANQEWTCCAWVKLTGTDSSQYLNNFNLANIIRASTTPLLYINSGSHDYYMYGSVALSTDTWTHIAFVFKNSTGLRNIYINGELKNGYGPNKDSTPAGIPSTITVFGGYFDGYVSDYREYATALSATQVAELYNTAVSVANNGTLMGYELVEV